MSCAAWVCVATALLSCAAPEADQPSAPTPTGPAVTFVETAPESAEQWAHIRVVGPAGSLEFDLPIKREPTHDPAGNTRVLDHGPGLTAVNLVQTEVYGGSVRILGARADRLLLEVYYYEDATNNTGVDTVTQQVAVPIGEPSELRIHKKVRVEVRYTTPQR